MIFFYQFATTTVTLDSLQVEIRGIGMSEIKQMIKDPKYTLLLMSLPKDTVIIPAKAVIGHHQKRELIHVGKSVKFSTGSYEVCL